MAKRVTFSDRFPFAGLFIVIAIALAVPLTVWSLNHAPTQTKNYAQVSQIDDLEVGVDDNLAMSPMVNTTTSTATVSTCPSKSQILSKFGANVLGSANCKMLLAIYNAYDAAFDWTKYSAMIQSNTPFNLHLIVKNLGDYKCGGYVPDKNNIYIYDLNDCVSSAKATTYIIIHETAHLVGQRNKTLYDTYPIGTLATKDKSCYDNKFLKSYNRRDTIASNESMAEASALLILNSRKGALATITDFKSQCDYTYAEIKSSFFGQIRSNTGCVGRLCPL